ncbi:acyltransferase [Streptomyces sp. NPDC089799]|uniref:acyltransferase family protein n=1 Tax=Streptomyces sp. NPDC089799 TaxID=3155066 RepID=UPI00342EE85A
MTPVTSAAPTPRPAELPTLTGIRFIAAVLVFLAHMSGAYMFTSENINTGLDRYLGTVGFPALSFFFMLSGFVLTWSARPGDRPALFWRRRFTKVYPTHFVAWIAGFALAAVAGQAVAGKEFLPGLFLVQAWFPEYAVVRGVNGPAWSLGAELVFYLCFPFLLVLVKRIRAGRLWAWAGAMVLGPAAIAVAAETLLPYQDMGLSYGWYQFWFVYFLPVSRLFEFVLGMLLARLVIEGRWIRISRTAAALTLVPGYLGTLYLPGSYTLVLPALIPMALVLGSAAQGDADRRGGFLAGRTMVRLGELSFAIYVVHMLVAYYGPVDFGTGHQWDTAEAVARIGVWLVLTLVLAWVLHRFVELPAMQRWSRPRARQAVPQEPEGTRLRAPGGSHVVAGAPRTAARVAPAPAPAPEPAAARHG